ncbi:MAG: ABC transporter substrate-binding protein [Brevinematia bacterium]
MKKILLFSVITLVFNISLYSKTVEDLKNFDFPKREGREVLILMSDKISTFEEVSKGIEESLEGYNVYTYNFLGNTNLMKEVPDIISKIKPNVVVVLGTSVLENLVGKVKTPIVFSMVINYKKLNVENYDNISGISLQIHPESVFFNLKTIFPNFRKVGVICGKDYYNNFISPFTQGLKSSLQIDIVPQIISSSEEFIPSYNSLSKQVDVLWMVPDTTVIDKNSIIYFINESFKSSKPTVVYSEPFVKAGGFFSVSPNYDSLGSQIALIVRRIVEDKISPSKIGIAPVVGTFTTVNKEMAKKLKVDESLLGLVDNVVE